MINTLEVLKWFWRRIGKIICTDPVKNEEVINTAKEGGKKSRVPKTKEG
jgi:hypothetical protein